MRIIILGVTGGTGQQLIAQALARQDEVTAVARRPEALDHYRSPNLRVVTANVFDADALAHTFGGHDAVVSALGTGNRRQSHGLYSKSITAIVEAMRATRIDRLVCISSSGTMTYPTERTLLSYLTNFRPGEMYFRYVMKPILQNVYDDMKAMETTLLNARDIRWTVVRPTMLTDGAPKHHFRVELNQLPKQGWQISRADVAAFVLDQLYDDTYLHQRPIIAY